MGRHCLSQPDEVLLKSLPFALKRYDFVFNVPDVLISALNLSFHAEDGFFKLTDSVQQ